MAGKRGSRAPALAELRTRHSSCEPPCIASQCRRPGCTLLFPAGQVICVDCDACRAFPEGVRRPDFIALHLRSSSPTEGWWLVVEMKSRPQGPREIVEQLQAGASTIETQDQFAIAQSPRRLLPVVLRTRGMHVADLQIINRSRVSFRGKRHVIKSARCGVALRTLLE